MGAVAGRYARNYFILRILYLVNIMRSRDNACTLVITLKNSLIMSPRPKSLNSQFHPYPRAARGQTVIDL